MKLKVFCFFINLGFPGAFYFIAGVSATTLIFPDYIIGLGIMLTTFSDPAAALLGTRFSDSLKLWGEKNVAGTFGSAIIYTISTFLYLKYVTLHPEFLEKLGGLFTCLALCCVNIILEMIPFGGSIGKYFRFDDNLFGMLLCCAFLNLFYICY
jgi:dolichol kinase